MFCARATSENDFELYNKLMEADDRTFEQN